jgi:hypothetical protein
MTAAPASMSAGLCRRGSCRHHGVADQAQRLSRRQHVHTMYRPCAVAASAKIGQPEDGQ